MREYCNSSENEKYNKKQEYITKRKRQGSGKCKDVEIVRIEREKKKINKGKNGQN